MTAAGADPLLRRLERRALVFCLVAAGVTLVAQGGRTDVALGVVGGGALIGVSYWAIRSSIDGILALAVPGGANAVAAGPAGLKAGASEERAAVAVEGSAVAAPRRGRAIGYALRFVGRYAVLGVLAYVMLAWLRLHPVGLILGVSSIAVAAAWEAATTVTAAPRT